MIPTVAQQLFAVRNTIAKALMPALDSADGFAVEQAGLVLASLDWILDVQGSEYSYESKERVENRDTLAALRDLDPSAFPEAEALLESSTLSTPDLHELRADVRRIKSAVAQSYTRIVEQGGSPAVDARRILADAAARQTRRELAWCRMTGFPQGQQPGIAEVLRFTENSGDAASESRTAS